MRHTLWITLAVACTTTSTPSDDTDTDPDTVDTDETDANDTGGPDTGDTLDTDDTDEPAPLLPDCTEVDAFVTFTRDAGATLTPSGAGPMVNTYTWGIALSPDEPDLLWAEHGGILFESTDAGCTWDALDTLPGPWWRLVGVGGSGAVGYQENGGYVLRIDGSTYETIPFDGSILGLGPDPADPSHLRVGAWDGQLYDKVGADRWNALGGPVKGGIAYAWAFDPADPDRVVAGLLGEAAWFSHDGGQTWTKSTGFSASTNVFSLVWSPVDPNVVWAEGKDIVESDAGTPSQGRHVWRSEDGGASFTPVVDQGGDITLSNGVPMAADPRDANVVWFSWGSSFQGTGTWLYRYDHAAEATTWNHTGVWHAYQAIAPSPHDPDLVYLGLVREQISAH